MRIDMNRIRHRRLEQALQTTALILALGGLAAFLGFLLGGPLLAGLAVALAAGGIVAGHRQGGALLLRLHRAQPLQAPHLAAVVATLSERAGLPRPPRLLWIPSPIPNALSLVVGSQPVVAVTEGLLRQLSLRELSGVLAHEIGHIRNGDLLILTLAGSFARFTAAIAPLGAAAALVGALLDHPPATLLGATVALGPGLATLLVLALSRTREFAADLTAAELTGDPAGLISALTRLERPMWRWWTQPAHPPEPSFLRTHPETSRRIANLRTLLPQQRPVRLLSRPRVAWL